MKPTKKDLINYLMPPLKPMLAGVIWIGIGIMCRELQGMILVGILLAVLSVLPTVKQIAAIYSKIGALEKEGTLEDALEDFFTADSYINDYVRLGDTYIFGRQLGTIVRHDEIRKTWQYARSRNFNESSRFLRAELKGGSVCNLTKLPTMGKGNEELERILKKIGAINPKAKLETEVKKK